MNQDELNVKYHIRIPMIDKLLEQHNIDHVSIVSVTNTEEDKKKLRKLDIKLDKDISRINDVIDEVLKYLEARGCEVSKYI